MIAQTAMLAVERVALVHAEPAGASDSTWFILLALAGVALAAGGLVSRAAWRDRRRDAPEARAFRRLCQRLGVSRSEAALVDSAAKRAGLAPVAFLVSRAAFDNASGSEPGGPWPGLRRKLFSDR